METSSHECTPNLWKDRYDQQLLFMGEYIHLTNTKHMLLVRYLKENVPDEIYNTVCDILSGKIQEIRNE